MNISRKEQRVLHALAQGGCIRYTRGPNGRITEADCFTHDNLILADCDLDTVRKLRRKRLIESRSSGPYRISRAGRLAVRAQANNRT